MRHCAEEAEFLSEEEYSEVDDRRIGNYLRTIAARHSRHADKLRSRKEGGT